ncbi:azurocidin-like [Symsagittifera roscoffensis]|uniref:azurocidin-like n=1 Tax=Symsagittifera roscoffensis TaxID=84072 RepID=UPI00307B35EC
MYCNCTLRMIFFLVLFDTLKLVLTKSYNIVESESNSNETTETKVKLQSFRNLIINGTPSPRRLFYARVKLIRQHGFCGASILEGSFILTAASCVAAKHPDEMIVEVGDFSRIRRHYYPSNKITLYPVNAIYLAPGFEEGVRPKNDLAILKLKYHIPGTWFYALPICSEEVPETDYGSTLVGSCGMGYVSTSRDHTAVSHKLKEIYFTMTIFDSSEGLFFSRCREDNICTTPILDGGNICIMDEGGPLFKFHCDTMEPECILGVASYSMSKPNTSVPTQHREICNDGSYFTRLSLFQDWIDSVLLNRY